MCGIAGLAGSALVSSQGGEAAVRAMCDRIVHRGPDQDGYFTQPSAALGMRRLSIIDVAGGRQPIQNEAGDVTVVFNGEIYNHHRLRGELRAAGHRFRTRSDTETLVHLYEECGDAMVDALRGMFAFALWDARRSRLLLARDRIGIKPLYYREANGGVAFASELQCIAGLRDLSAELDHEAIAWYLALGYVPDPRSVYRDVRKLPPGHVLTWDADSGVRISRYWTPACEERADLDEIEAIREVQRLIEESVAMHLEADVPLGAFLSGGLDSSTVVATMCRQAPGRVRTFSIGFDEAGYNEAPDAAAIARALGTEHTELVVRPDADALVDDIVTAFDEPFADSSALPTFLVSKLARQSVAVALSGDGGDELFGGYTRYRRTLASAGVPRVLRAPLRSIAARLPHALPGRNRLLDWTRDMRGRYAATVALPLRASEGGVAARSVADSVPALDDYLDGSFLQAATRDFPTQMTLVDMLTYLPGDILTKVDRMSMKVSLEARVPLLDHELIEFAVSLPGKFKLRDGSGKWILRRAAQGLVPEMALRKAKRGFEVPLAQWFRGPLRHRLEALARARSRLEPWVDFRALERILGEHLCGRRDHSAVLWRLVVLDRWLESRA